MKKITKKKIHQKLAVSMMAIVLINQLCASGSIVYASEMADESMENCESQVGTELSQDKTEEIETEQTEAETKAEEEMQTQTEEAGEEKETESEQAEAEVESEQAEAEVEAEQEETEETTEMPVEDKETEPDFGVTFLFDAQGGFCETQQLTVDPENRTYRFPSAVLEGFEFTGWFMDPACEYAFFEDDIMWEMGYEYTLFAGYRAKTQLFSEQMLEQTVDGIRVSVEGNFPQGISLQVKTVDLEPEVKQELAKVSDIIQSVNDINVNANKTYIYDITLLYEEGEYEPYEFDEKVKVLFQFEKQRDTSGKDRFEVIHIEDNSNHLEQMPIMYASEAEICFEADHFSRYIIVTDITFYGEKEWEFDYTGQEQTFVVPYDGYYFVELWGAQGANNGAKGLYTNAKLELKKGEVLQIHVGGQNGYNGGGQGHFASDFLDGVEVYAKAYNGGGATDIRIQGNELANRIMVAGGGSGGIETKKVGYDYTHEQDIDGNWICSIDYFDTIRKISMSPNANANGVFGNGSDAEVKIEKQNWSHLHDPKYIYVGGQTAAGTLYTGKGASGGGGGYYGGQKGFAGTSYVDTDYLVDNATVTDINANSGNGKAAITLLAGRFPGAQFQNVDGGDFGFLMADSNGHILPFQQETPRKEGNEKYRYEFRGWDIIGTQQQESYSHADVANLVFTDYTILLATYEQIGQSYQITFDEEMASVSGTTQISAVYEDVLPDIMIPEKPGFIFDGYYTQRHGAGKKYYQSNGIALEFSDFVENTTLYANWIDPLLLVEKSDEKKLYVGYTGVELTQEVRLQPSAGFDLSYRWLVCEQNTSGEIRVIDGATTSKCFLPNLRAGQYDVFCEVTATNCLNHQSVTKTALVTKVTVEKGIMDLHDLQVKYPNVVYDGEEHPLEIELSVDGTYQIYYSENVLNKDNYLVEGTTDPYTYSQAGNYKNYVYVVLERYEDFSTSIMMQIQKATPKICLSDKSAWYTPGQKQAIADAQVYGIQNALLPSCDVTYSYYADAYCTDLTSDLHGANDYGKEPENVGTYYVLATVAETENYHQATSVNPAVLKILKQQSAVQSGKPTGNGGSGSNAGQENANEANAGGNIVKPSNPADQHAHMFDSYTYFLPPTFETSGYAIYPCIICGYEQRVDFDKLAGAPSVKPVVEKKEPKPAETVKPDKKVEKTNNDNVKKQNTKTEKEKKEETCKKHSYVLVEKKAATKTEGGYAVYQCSGCKEVMVKDLEKIKEKEKKEDTQKLKEVEEEETPLAKEQINEEDDDPSLEKAMSKLSAAEKTQLLKRIALYCIVFFVLLLIILIILSRVMHRRKD